MLTGSSMKNAMMVMTWNRFMLSSEPCVGVVVVVVMVVVAVVVGDTQ